MGVLSSLRLLTSNFRPPRSVALKACGLYASRTAHRRRHHCDLAGADCSSIHVLSKAGPTSPAPHTRSKACSTPPARTRKQTTLMRGSVFLRKTFRNRRLLRRRTRCAPAASVDSLCRSSLRRMERTSTTRMMRRHGKLHRSDAAYPSGQTDQDRQYSSCRSSLLARAPETRLTHALRPRHERTLPFLDLESLTLVSKHCAV